MNVLPALLLLINNAITAHDVVSATTSIMYFGNEDDILYQQFYDSVKATNIGRLEVS